MKSLRRLFPFASLFVLFALSGCNVSLAADVTPPPDYRPPATVQPVALETVFPLVPPDPSAGQVIYEEKCLPCHGATGKGDGPQAANLPSPPPSIGSAEVAGAARPVDWFNIVTQGNLQNFMPGFSGSLNDRQRWDVVAYVYSLSLPADAVEQGQQLYAGLCTECHGETGRGDGPRAAEFKDALHDWAEPARLVQLSGQEMVDLMVKGSPNGMPAFQEQLDNDLAGSLAAYLRTLSFAGGAEALAAQPSPAASEAAPTAPSSPAAPEATSQAAPAATSGPMQISGRVINASGGSLPAGLEVRLTGYDQMTPAFNLTAKANADGSFVFEPVELADQRVFMASVDYHGYTFNSDILHAGDILPGAENSLNLHVFDTSTDTSALVADRMHVFFDFSKPDVVQVGELFIISNPTNKMIVAAESGKPVLTFPLPEGASNLSFQDGALGERFVETENGFGDTASIQPGAGGHQVLFAYDLPYDHKLSVSITPPVAVDAAVVIAPSSGIKVQSDQLTDAGERAMQDVAVHLYSAANIAPGNSLNVTLSGRVGGGFLEQTSTTSIIIGAAALLVALLALLLFVVRRGQSSAPAPAPVEVPDRPETSETLLDDIVALDDLYQSGSLPKEAYDERRAELKERLRVARERESAGS